METDKYNRQPDGTFGPGNLANPKGRPPKSQTVTEFLRQRIPADVLADMIAEKVKAGNDTFIKTVLEYYDGKPINKILEGKLDIVESEEWELLLRLIIPLVEKHPEIKSEVDEIFRRMDDTGRSSRACNEALAVDSGPDTECGTGVEGKTDNMQLSSSVGEIHDDSNQGPTPSKVLAESTDIDSITDGEAKPGVVPEDIRGIESDTEAEKD